MRLNIYRNPFIVGALGAAFALAFQLVSASPAQAANQCPSGGTKIDESGSATFTCPTEGDVIVGICVKAGNAVYGEGDTGGVALSAGPADCYVFSGLGTSTGTADRIGSGRNCKGISHSEFYCDAGATPTPTPSPSPSPPPSPSASPTP